MRTLIVIALCLAAALAFAHAEPKQNAPRKEPAEHRDAPPRVGGQSTLSFFVSPVGTGVAPPGPAFTLATLADVQSDAFVSWYNSNALVDATEESFSSGCCIFGLADTDGSLVYWTYGGPDSAGAPSYVATYTSSGARQCAVEPVNPVYLGTAPDSGQYPSQYFGSLTSTMTSLFGTVNFVGAEIGCDNPAVVFGLWKPLPQFVVGVYGIGYPAPPAGYQHTSLADVQSSAFAAAYNANGGGFPYIGGYSPSTCCSFALDSADINGVPNEVLVYGTSSSFSSLEPFYNGGKACYDSLSSPVEFGTLTGTALPTMTAGTQEMLFEFSVNLTSWCAGSLKSFALFTAIPQFIVAATGQDFPYPPDGYALASLADIQSLLFLSVYNNGGMPWVNPSGADFYGCCVMSQADGFLLYSGSNVGPYTAAGSFECTTQPASPIWLGTAPDGPDPREFIGQMTSAEASAFLSVNATLNPQLGCSSSVNYFAIFKAVATGSARKPATRRQAVPRREAVRAAPGSSHV